MLSMLTPALCPDAGRSHPTLCSRAKRPRPESVPADDGPPGSSTSRALVTTIALLETHLFAMLLLSASPGHRKRPPWSISQRDLSTCGLKHNGEHPIGVLVLLMSGVVGAS